MGWIARGVSKTPLDKGEVKIIFSILTKKKVYYFYDVIFLHYPNTQTTTMGVDLSKFGGIMRKLSHQPKNPKHFIALCFIELRKFPELRLGNELLVKISEHKNVALFKCAYGYFFVAKNMRVSKEFIKDSKVTFSRFFNGY